MFLRLALAALVATTLLCSHSAHAQVDAPAPSEPAQAVTAEPPPAAEPAGAPAASAPVGDLDPAYQELVKAGVDAQAAGDFVRAHEAFEKAHALYPNARALRAMGVASFKAGAFVRAIGELEAALKDQEKPLDERLRAGAEDLLVRAQREVSVVLLSVDPEGAAISVDGEPSARAAKDPLVLEPGSHRLRITADGRTPQEFGIQALKGARQSLSVVLVPLGAPPAAPPRVVIDSAPKPQVTPAQRAHRRRLLGLYVSGALALASGITSGALYAAARQRLDAIDQACRASELGGCTPAQKNEQAQAARLPTFERSINATLGVALAGAVATIGLASWDYFASGRRMELRLSHETLTLHGTF